MDRGTQRVDVPAFPSIETNVSLSQCQESKAQNFASSSLPNKPAGLLPDAILLNSQPAEAVLDATSSWREDGLGHHAGNLPVLQNV